jgi:6,7-dimethyl-8-ribityllumazine synthase
MAEKPLVLIVEARFYEDIADSLASGAEQALRAAGADCERVAVPGVFEIPAAIKFASQAIKGGAAERVYHGYVALGCVIRGETDHYEHICREVSRALMEFTINELAPHGFGILTCENREQAWERADVKQRNLGARAAQACLRMMELKDQFLPASL